MPFLLKEKLDAALEKFLTWRSHHLSNKNFLLLISVLVGLFSGFAAVLLKRFVFFIERLLHTRITEHYQHYFFFIYPLAGILLTVFYVHVIHKASLGRGVKSILFAIVRKKGHVEKRKTYSHLISSALTVGFGGSVGLEAPIVVTGSAIGSTIARKLGFSEKERILLLTSGAAAGIAAIFNCPIAGVIFAIEVLLSEFTIPAFIPLLISTATASVISNLFYSEQLFFLITDGWHYNAIPFYIMLGIMLGLLSVYIIRMEEFTVKFFTKKKSIYTNAVKGGLILGGLIFIIPPLYGEGYEVIEHLLRGEYGRVLSHSLFEDKMHDAWFILFLTAGIVFIKIFATGITIGAGGNGGTFAPSLFIGACAGFVFSQAVNLSGISYLTIPNFIVAGMAGVLSGAIHAPLTAIFLIAEITGGYKLFIPLMIVSALSYFIARFFEPHSIYTKQLAKKGYITGNKDKAVLNDIKLKHLIENDFAAISQHASLGELVKTVAHSKRNVFAVIGERGELAGIVLLDDIREIMFQHQVYTTIFVKDIMIQPPAVVAFEEELYTVMRKFDDHNAWNLPVRDASGRYLGFISKSKIFNYYRNRIINQSTEIA